MYVVCTFFFKDNTHFPPHRLLDLIPEMVKKPIPPPLSLTQAKIEKEKLEVLQRTDRRLAEIMTLAEARIPQSSRLYSLAFPVLVILLYTALSFATKCQCTCNV